MNKTFQYKTEQFLPIEISKAWHFFSSAKNLAVITPPEMDFRISTLLDDKEIFEGMLIDYRVKPLFGIPVKWQTEICKIVKPVMFTDRQLKGPYRIWEHTHTFTPTANGVLIKDEVKYQLPFGAIGRLVHFLIVKKRIATIFHYRRQVLHKLFSNHE